MTRRVKTLFICSHTPGPNAPEAGHKTAWRNIERLAESSDVDVVLVTNASELQYLPKEWPAHVRLLGTVAITKFDKILAVLTHMRRWSPRFSARLTPAAIAMVREALDGRTHYDGVWLEFTECAGFIGFIPSEMPVTISAPDVLIQWALRSTGIYRYLAASTFNDELAVFSRAQKVIVQSPKDAELVRALYSIRHVDVDVPALAPFLANFNRDPDSVVPKSVLFWGAMSRPENSRAVLRFLKEHWPAITAEHPEAVMYIVGSNPPPDVLACASNSVKVTGFLEDPSPYFRQASLGVAPLEEGAGIKVKVLEMLAAGMPVVSTPVGAEGILPVQALHTVEFGKVGDVVRALFETQKS